VTDPTAPPASSSSESGWLLDLAAAARFGPGDRRGTANYIDRAARGRAAQAVNTGETISLARPLADGPTARRDGRRTVSVETFVTGAGATSMGSDHVELDCHGLQNTHLDALNHVGIAGTWYGGWALDDPAASSLTDLVEVGLVTRAVLVDIPAVRSTPWVAPGEPVTGADIDAALTRSGTTFESGDALLLYMGRDRYEAAGNVYGASLPSPGLGEDGVRWVADHEASLLCWDFLDANAGGPRISNGHSLVWAIGQLLVDNCDFAALRGSTAEADGVVGALVLAPLALPGATGCIVNPLVLR
jgi:kynurenine formamidase